MSDGQRFIRGQYDRQEEKDLRKFTEEFVMNFPKNYEASGSTRAGCKVDVLSRKADYSIVATELKGRSEQYTGDTYTTLFIEDEKFKYLVKLWQDYGIETWYCNMFEHSDVYYHYHIPTVASRWWEIATTGTTVTYNELGETKKKQGIRWLLPKAWAYRIEDGRITGTPEVPFVKVNASKYNGEFWSGMDIKDVIKNFYE